jgi:hypothetical protein
MAARTIVETFSSLKGSESARAGSGRHVGRCSIAPKKLLRALLLQACTRFEASGS